MDILKIKRKRCRKHLWIKELVEVIPRIKLNTGAINRVYINPIQAEICFRCDKIRNDKK